MLLAAAGTGAAETNTEPPLTPARAQVSESILCILCCWVWGWGYGDAGTLRPVKGDGTTCGGSIP